MDAVEAGALSEPEGLAPEDAPSSQADAAAGVTGPAEAGDANASSGLHASAPEDASSDAQDAGSDAHDVGPAAQGLGSSFSSFPEDCDRVVEIHAHAAQTSDDTTPYVAPNGEHIETFWVVPNWDTKMQLTYAIPIVDNLNVMRELRVYMQEQGTAPSGSHAASSGSLPSDASLLMDWAMGDRDVRPPADVGLQVVHGSAARLGLEISYSATPNVPKHEDRSGVRMCLTSKLRVKEAAFHWLGTERLGNLFSAQDQTVSVSGECSVKHATHILGYAPRMRSQGRHINATLTKRDGSTTTLFDRPFEAHRQDFAWLPQEVSVSAGDVISTTCSHARDKSFWFGAGDRDEICYALVLAWPAGSLTNVTPSSIAGLNTCWDGR